MYWEEEDPPLSCSHSCFPGQNKERALNSFTPLAAVPKTPGNQILLSFSWEAIAMLSSSSDLWNVPSGLTGETHKSRLIGERIWNLHPQEMSI